MKSSENTGDRGDCIYLPRRSNRNKLKNSINQKNKYIERSNFACGEPEQNPKCLSTTSDTFIVSLTSPSETTIDSNINIPSLPLDNKYHLWFKQHWISLTIFSGLILISIIIITIMIIY